MPWGSDSRALLFAGRGAAPRVARSWLPRVATLRRDARHAGGRFLVLPPASCDGSARLKSSARATTADHNPTSASATNRARLLPAALGRGVVPIAHPPPPAGFNVGVGVFVGVAVGVGVGVAIDVAVGVVAGVRLALGVGDGVEAAVAVGVNVGVAEAVMSTAGPGTPEFRVHPSIA